MPPTVKRSGQPLPDRFWLIESARDWVYYEPAEERYVEPVTDIATDIDGYVEAGRLEGSGRDAKRIHGRRCNHEVELFEWDDGKETPGLRQALESKGLKVRTYLPQQAKKFPQVTYKGTMGLVPTSSHLKQCLYRLRHRMDQRGYDAYTDDVVLAIANGENEEQVMCAAKLKSETFATLSYKSTDTMIMRGCRCKILAFLPAGNILRLKCSEKIFASYFSLLEDGSVDIELGWFDEAEEERKSVVVRIREALRIGAQTQDRRAASGDGDIDAPKPSEEDPAKAAQKLRRRAKGKAQKQRRKAKLAAEKEHYSQTYSSPEKDSLFVPESSSNTLTYFQTKNGPVRIKLKNGVASHDLDDPNRNGGASQTSTREECTQPITNTDTEPPVRIIHVNSAQEVTEACEAAAVHGGTVMVAYQDEAEGGGSRQSLSNDLRHLDRGL